MKALASDLGVPARVARHARYGASLECSADAKVRVYVEPFSVGSRLPPLPLFIDPGRAIDLPLEVTYSETIAELPDVDRRLLGRGAP